MRCMNYLIILTSMECLGQSDVQLDYSASNRNNTYLQSHGSHTNSTIKKEDNIVSDKDSLEWMIGRWDCTRVEKYGVTSPVLDRMGRICVFPYFDYSKMVPVGGTLVSAEIQTKKQNGDLEVTRQYFPVRVYPKKIESGFGQVWVFQYSHGRTNSRPWLKLELKTDDGVNYMFMFEKQGNDPGVALDVEMLLNLTPIDTEDAKKYEALYRESKKGVEDK